MTHEKNGGMTLRGSGGISCQHRPCGTGRRGGEAPPPHRQKNRAAQCGRGCAVEPDAPRSWRPNAGAIMHGGARGLTGALLDRLRLDDNGSTLARDTSMIIERLADPIGKAAWRQWSRRNGMQIESVCVTPWAWMHIYESPPNVTATPGAVSEIGQRGDLRGGSESARSRRGDSCLLGTVVRRCGSALSLHSTGPTTDRAVRRPYVRHCMADSIDVMGRAAEQELMPRVQQEARVTVHWANLEGSAMCMSIAVRISNMARGIVPNARARTGLRSGGGHLWWTALAATAFAALDPDLIDAGCECAGRRGERLREREW